MSNNFSMKLQLKLKNTFWLMCLCVCACWVLSIECIQLAHRATQVPFKNRNFFNDIPILSISNWKRCYSNIKRGTIHNGCVGVYLVSVWLDLLWEWSALYWFWVLSVYIFRCNFHWTILLTISNLDKLYFFMNNE